ncbi:MAG: BolA/IbaG family iron-sulfur metabolism protein [Bdellovibrionaceae bacterium]|jgi:stress-induced morphogen|nr:BolA/IbaG family iron-sulfur metabolism protein [Pseudobdellovibrionaceae bacterium]
MTQEYIEDKIQKSFPGSDVVAMDLTGGGDHWEVRVAAKEFKDMNRIKRHQAIMSVFDVELKSGELHALSIKTIEK